MSRKKNQPPKDAAIIPQEGETRVRKIEDETASSPDLLKSIIEHNTANKSGGASRLGMDAPDTPISQLRHLYGQKLTGIDSEAIRAEFELKLSDPPNRLVYKPESTVYTYHDLVIEANRRGKSHLVTKERFDDVARMSVRRLQEYQETSTIYEQVIDDGFVIYSPEDAPATTLPPDEANQHASPAIAQSPKNPPDEILKKASEIDARLIADRVELAKILEPIINERLTTAIAEKYPYRIKATIAQTINDQVKTNGLNIVCKVSNKDSEDYGKSFPGILVVDQKGKDAGRFRFHYRDDSGKQKPIGLSSVEGVHLEPLPSELVKLFEHQVATSFVEMVSDKSSGQQQQK